MSCVLTPFSTPISNSTTLAGINAGQAGGVTLGEISTFTNTNAVITDSTGDVSISDATFSPTTGIGSGGTIVTTASTPTVFTLANSTYKIGSVLNLKNATKWSGSVVPATGLLLNGRNNSLVLPPYTSARLLAISANEFSVAKMQPLISTDDKIGIYATSDNQEGWTDDAFENPVTEINFSGQTLLPDVDFEQSFDSNTITLIENTTTGIKNYEGIINGQTRLIFYFT